MCFTHQDQTESRISLSQFIFIYWDSNRWPLSHSLLLLPLDHGIPLINWLTLLTMKSSLLILWKEVSVSMDDEHVVPVRWPITIENNFYCITIAKYAAKYKDWSNLVLLLYCWYMKWNRFYLILLLCKCKAYRYCQSKIMNSSNNERI